MWSKLLWRTAVGPQPKLLSGPRSRGLCGSTPLICTQIECKFLYRIVRISCTLWTQRQKRRSYRWMHHGSNPHLVLGNRQIVFRKPLLSLGLLLYTYNDILQEPKGLFWGNPKCTKLHLALCRGYACSKIILKLFHCFISHLTTSETEIKLLNEFWNYFKIISAAVNTFGKYSWAAISLWNNFEITSGKFSRADIKLFQTDVDEGWNNFEIILFHV